MIIFFWRKQAPSVMTPAARQSLRKSQGHEIDYTWLKGNGSLFTLLGGAPTHGSIAYGLFGFMYDINESSRDGGVQTADPYLQSALRSLGIYSETAL